MSTRPPQHHILSTLKHEIHHNHQRKYQQINQKNNQKYYELYLQKIITIQRYWRRRLVMKGVMLERVCLKKMKEFQKIREENDGLKRGLEIVKRRKGELENVDPNVEVERIRGGLDRQLKLSLQNLLQGADRYAKIKAVLKSQMMSFQSIVKENQALKKSCQQSSLETESLKDKNLKLAQKIKILRGILAEEKTDIMLLKQQQNLQNIKTCQN